DSDVSSVCFFQAEDGIRVFHVTGVQTCSLPISVSGSVNPARARILFTTASTSVAVFPAAPFSTHSALSISKSVYRKTIKLIGQSILLVVGTLVKSTNFLIKARFSTTLPYVYPRWMLNDLRTSMSAYFSSRSLETGRIVSPPCVANPNDWNHVSGTSTHGNVAPTTGLDPLEYSILKITSLLRSLL